MSRPIDANHLKRWILSRVFKTQLSVADVVDQIDREDTIEPERKRGQWIPVDSFSAFGGDEITWMAHGNPIAFYYCSECKNQAYLGEDGEALLTEFCPDCGAYMGGEYDEQTD